MTRVFVTGGTGLLGTDLITMLLERGDQVVGLARCTASEQALRARGVEVTRGDVCDQQAMAAGMRGCELAFHVAGVNSFCLADPAPMLRANVDGALAAVNAARQAGVARLVLTSSAATIGERAGVVADEHTPHRGHFLSAYERSKTLGERAAKRAAGEIGQDVVYVNPASVQGPGRAGGTGRFLLAFIDGRLKLFVDTYVSLVDIQDCSAGHLLAAERGAAGERYLLSGIGMTIGEALSLAAAVAGVQRSPRLAPRPLASASATVVEYAFRLRGRRPPVCREMVRTLLRGHHYDGSRAERELGLRYTPAAETLQRTVAWARAQGLLKNV
ncbi:MAG: NAD-dependent epimerase/dehydratase family protein [Solirubrobacteraceae bacterium]